MPLVNEFMNYDDHKIKRHKFTNRSKNIVIKEENNNYEIRWQEILTKKNNDRIRDDRKKEKRNIKKEN